jgi:hypothetical protein
LDVWVEIVKQHFMRYLASEYKNMVAKLVKEKRILFVDVRGTKRLNDDSRLYLAEDANG